MTFREWMRETIVRCARDLGVPKTPRNAVLRNAWPGEIYSMAVPTVFDGWVTIEKLDDRFREKCTVRIRRGKEASRKAFLWELRFYDWTGVADAVEAELLIFP